MQTPHDHVAQDAAFELKLRRKMLARSVVVKGLPSDGAEKRPVKQEEERQAQGEPQRHAAPDPLARLCASMTILTHLGATVFFAPQRANDVRFAPGFSDCTRGPVRTHCA